MQHYLYYLYIQRHSVEYEKKIKKIFYIHTVLTIEELKNYNYISREGTRTAQISIDGLQI